MSKLKFKILFFFCFVSVQQLFGTHNRSGEITYQQIGPLTIRATITTYTKTSSTAADRDSLELFWGDGTSELVARSNGTGDEISGEDIKVNYYIADHTYPGRATYTMSFEDPNRVNNILNVNFPNSVDVPFFVSTTFTLINTQFQGFNNSIILLQPPIDFACANQRFIHNPNAYDIDGDSLSYELISPLQSNGVPVPSYQFPNEVSAGPNNNIFLDPITGDFIWDSPKQSGEYNIAIKINEYRNGILLNSVIRDMQIRVQPCDNQPPTIDVPEEICVIAGETIDIDVLVDDPDDGQLVRLSATGGPFLEEISPASLSGDNTYQDKPLSEKFIWRTTCEHISENYYQVVFKAQDNGVNLTSGLSELKTVRIKVLGPPPENLTAESVNNQINLEWDFPYACENADDNYFIGFSVWRKINTNPFIPDSCENGLIGRGYEAIRFLTNENNGSKYTFTDTDVEKGRTYCYRVLANFALRTSSGNPFNIVESITSNEVCLQLKQDIPLLTEVSVRTTSITEGVIEVSWIKPFADDLDTILNPGPYRYVLKRSTDGILFDEVVGADISTTNFNEIDVFNFTDRNLNTLQSQFFYEVDFYSNNNFYDTSPSSASVFIEIRSSDNINNVSWREETSWQNYNYKIFRKDNVSTTFTQIAETQDRSYNDRDVQNDLEYCYFVQTEGTYGLDNVPSPLFNLSQENCGTPLDSIGPCTPTLEIVTPCNNEASPGQNQFANQLSWNRPDLVCTDSEDLSGYNIYYSSSTIGDLTLIATLDFDEISFEHIPQAGINGCYSISAFDQLGNEGIISDLFCVDNCPVYILPNTFTPNNDGTNELFIPIENRFVFQVSFQVFNRWGKKIFETSDPELNWNGKDTNGNELDDGTYYYTCNIFDLDNDGNINQVEELNGFIQILR